MTEREINPDNEVAHIISRTMNAWLRFGTVKHKNTPANSKA